MFSWRRQRRRADRGRRAEAIRDPLTAGRGPVARLGGALAAALLCALAAGGLWRWAQRTQTFAVQRVLFQGTSRAPEAELLRLSGLSAGQNLWSLDLAAVERALLAHPWVHSAVVRRRLPRALVVTVVEHVPAGLLAMGDLYVVDLEGQPFKRVQAQDALDLPLLSGVDRDQYLADRPGWERRIRQALETAAEYQARFPGPAVRLSEVRLTAQGLSLFAGPHAEEIRLGDGPAAEPLERLKVIRRGLQDRALVAEVIRLDDRVRPGRAAVKALSISAPRSERSGAARPIRGPEGTR